MKLGLLIQVKITEDKDVLYFSSVFDRIYTLYSHRMIVCEYNLHLDNLSVVGSLFSELS